MSGWRGTARTSVLVAAVLLAAAGGAVVLAVRTWPDPDRGSGLRDEFTYDLSSLRATDPSLVRYAETEGFDPGFSEPRAVAVGPGDAIIVGGDGEVRAFGLDGAPQWSAEAPGPPVCLAVDENGTVYAGLAGRVAAYDPQAKTWRTWGSLGEGAVVTSVAVSAEGVYVADAGERLVIHYSRSGERLDAIGRKDPDKGVEGFVIPSGYFDVAPGAEGILWIVNPGRHRLEAYTADGCCGLTFGRYSTRVEGFCGCCNPTHIAVLPDGKVVTSEKGIPRVKVYDEEGEFEGVVAAPDAFAERTRGLDLATDSAGRVIVLDPVAKRVRVFVRKETGCREGADE